MRHFVFLRFPVESYTEELKCSIKKFMDDAQKALQGFQNYHMLENYPQFKSNGSADVLIELSFADAGVKDAYLKHPLHLALLNLIKPLVQTKAAFDDI